MRRRFGQPLLAFLLVAALYSATRSPWLDEWDSVQFALGLDAFNLTEHQPHPPGYPLFIFAGRVLRHGMGLNPVDSLTLVAAASGALFVAAWFALARRAFGAPFAWALAATLAFTPVVWMTSVKALSDAPSAAFLALEAAACWRVLTDRARGTAIAAGIHGAVAAGMRPQWFPVALALLLTALALTRARRAVTGPAIGAFLAGCLAWLLPTCYTQAVLTDPPEPAAYPRQLLKQWTWRLDKPEVFAGAGKGGDEYLRQRLDRHVNGWFRDGLGLRSEGVRRGGRALILGGIVLYVFFSIRRKAADGAFWRLHAPWSLLLVAIVLFSLPGDSRYYLAIMPLIGCAALRGWWLLPRPWKAVAAACPALMFSISAPLARTGMQEAPPPVQMIRLVEGRHPPADRSRVWLLFADSYRHAEWYASNAHVRVARPYAISEEELRDAEAVYTDTASLALRDNLKGMRLEPVAEFSRSRLVYPKHADVTLYRVTRSQAP